MTSWDPVWEEIFVRQAWGRYPPEELVRFVSRGYGAGPVRSDVRILELGCGPGGNLWYLAREGFAAYGIDGSSTAIEKARDRLAAESLAADLRVGDFTNLLEHYDPETFDAVIEVAAVQCNRYDAAARCLEHAELVLKPGGRVFSMMVAEGSWGDGLGSEVEPRTFLDVSEGPAGGTGLCRFSSLEDVERLFARFAEVEIEYSSRTLGGRLHTYAHWVVTASRST